MPCSPLLGDEAHLLQTPPRDKVYLLRPPLQGTKPIPCSPLLGDEAHLLQPPPWGQSLSPAAPSPRDEAHALQPPPQGMGRWEQDHAWPTAFPARGIQHRASPRDHRDPAPRLSPRWSRSWWFFSSLTARCAWLPRAPRASSPELLPVTGGMPGGWRPEGCGGSWTGGPWAAWERCWAWSCCCCNETTSEPGRGQRDRGREGGCEASSGATGRGTPGVTATSRGAAPLGCLEGEPR